MGFSKHVKHLIYTRQKIHAVVWLAEIPDMETRRFEPESEFNL